MSFNLLPPHLSGNSNAVTLNGAVPVVPAIITLHGDKAVQGETYVIGDDRQTITQLFSYGAYVYDNIEVYVINPIIVQFTGIYETTIYTAPASVDIYVSKLTEEEYEILQDSWEEISLLEERKFPITLTKVEEGVYTIDGFVVSSLENYFVFWFKIPVETILQYPYLKVVTEEKGYNEVDNYQIIPVVMPESEAGHTRVEITIKGEVEDPNKLTSSQVYLYDCQQEVYSNTRTPSLVNNFSFSVVEVAFEQQENGIMKLEFDSPFDFTYNQTYTVVIDGESYSAQCQAKGFTPYLGSEYDASSFDDELPFCFYNIPNTENTPGNDVDLSYSKGVALLKSTEEKHTIQIDSDSVAVKETKRQLYKIVNNNNNFLAANYINNDGSFECFKYYSPGTNAKNVLYIRSKKGNKIKINSIKYEYSTPSSEESCLSGDTLITMFDGSTKQMCDIQEGDMVLSHEGLPTRVYQTKNDAMGSFHTLYTFENGAVIDETGPHAFYNVEEDSYLALSSWKIGYHTLDEFNQPVALVSIQRINESKQRFGIWTESKTYYANGLLSGSIFIDYYLIEEADVDTLATMLGSFDAETMLQFLEY